MSTSRQQAPAHATKTLPRAPGLAAVWAAALTRPPVQRSLTLPPTTYAVRDLVIDYEKSTAFDHLMGAPSTAHAHPGLLHVMAFPIAMSLMATPRFPVPLLGLIHIENRVLQHRGINVGERIDIECRTQNLRQHKRGSTFEAVSVISSGGDIIMTDVSTYLARGSDAAARAGAPKAPQREPGTFDAPAPTARWKLPARTGRAYAAVSGDANPIHMSSLSAKAFGFPAAIAHGMYTASRAFSETLPTLSQPLSWDVTFAAPVVLPATVWMSYTNSTHAGRERTEYVGYQSTRGGAQPRLHFRGAVEHLTQAPPSSPTP